MPGLVAGVAPGPPGPPGPDAGPGLGALLAGRSLSGYLQDVTKELLLAAIDEAQGVRKEAARLLGITPQNLANYLRRLELRPPRLRSRGPAGGGRSRA